MPEALVSGCVSSPYEVLVSRQGWAVVTGADGWKRARDDDRLRLDVQVEGKISSQEGTIACTGPAL